MMRISTGIAPIWHALQLREEEILLALRDCGFECLCEEFRAPSACDAAAARERLRLLKDCGMTPVKARAVSDDPFSDTAEMARLISVCAAMEIPKLVIPLGTRPDNTREEYLRENRRYLGQLLPVARDLGVTLLIEHAGNYQNAHYTHCGPELNAFLEAMDAPDCLRVNVNIANQGKADLAMYPDIRVLGSRVAAVDASDNFFAMPLGVMKDREDLGLVPLMGFLDFDEILLALKEIGYQGEFNLLLNSPRVFDKTSLHVAVPKMRVMPFELVRRYFAWAYRVTAYMLESYGVQEVKEVRP